MCPIPNGFRDIAIFVVWLGAPSIVLPSRPAAGGKLNILGGHSIGHSKQKTLYEHVSYSKRFPR
jgi:hypothetical protein